MPVSTVLYKSLYWKALQFFISLLLNIFFVRSFQAEIIAEFHSLLYLYSFFISFFTFGLDVGIIYYVTRKQLTPTNTRVLILLVVAISLLVAIPLLYYFYNTSLYVHISRASLLLFATLYISGTLLLNLSSSLYTAYNQNYYPAKIAFIFSCLILFTGIILSYTLVSFNIVHSILIVYFILLFVQGVLSFLLTFRLNSNPEAISEYTNTPFYKIFQYSSTSFVISFLFVIGMKMNVLILPNWLSAKALGNYTQAYKLVEYIITLAGFITYPLIALISQSTNTERQHITLLVMRVTNTCITLFALILILCGYWLFPLLFGYSFTAVYSIFLCFIPGLIANAASISMTAYFFGTGMLNYIFKSAIILLLSASIFLILFINNLSIWGAAIAYSLACLLSFVYDLIVFRKLYSFLLKDMLFINSSDFKKIKHIVLNSNFYTR